MVILLCFLSKDKIRGRSGNNAAIALFVRLFFCCQNQEWKELDYPNLKNITYTQYSMIFSLPINLHLSICLFFSNKLYIVGIFLQIRDDHWMVMLHKSNTFQQPASALHWLVFLLLKSYYHKSLISFFSVLARFSFDAWVEFFDKEVIKHLFVLYLKVSNL